MSTLFPSVVQRRADPTYVLGRSRDEYVRLMAQAAVLAPMSRRLLAAAGVGPGMSVLDVGCGVGDLSMLAADIVGPTGHVLGVDLDPTALQVARSRAESAGLTQIEFVTGDLRDLSDLLQVDAMIGRLVLMYLAEPAEGLRLASRIVRPGGVVAFQELDLSSPPVSMPYLESWDRLMVRGPRGVRGGGGVTRTWPSSSLWSFGRPGSSPPMSLATSWSEAARARCSSGRPRPTAGSTRSRSRPASSTSRTAVLMICWSACA